MQQQLLVHLLLTWGDRANFMPSVVKTIAAINQSGGLKLSVDCLGAFPPVAVAPGCRRQLFPRAGNFT
jgi:hypothetical protein